MKRRRFISLASGSLVLATVRPGFPQLRGAGLIIAIYGNMSVERGNERLAGKMRMPLLAGDFVATDGGSRGALMLADGSMFKIAPDTRVQFVPRGKTLKVLQGEIFLDLKRQSGGKLQIQTPNGNAGIEGTTLDIKVAKANYNPGQDNLVTTLTVAKGSVTLSGLKVGHAVRVTAGQQSNLVAQMRNDTMVVPDALADEPTKPVNVDVDPIMYWAKTMKTYRQTLEKLQEVYAQIKDEAVARNGFLSPTTMQMINDMEDEVTQLVPDNDFLDGHRNLLLAIHNYKLAGAYTDPTMKANAEKQAEAAYRSAQRSYKWYMEKHQQELGPSLKGG